MYEIGTMCAQTMQAHETDFAPFCEYNTEEDIHNFNDYVQAVQSSSRHWGGHLEIRALSMALRRPIHIYSSNTLHTSGPLIIDAVSELTENTPITPHGDDLIEPIRLSYHLHYYALGEHYNQVIAVAESEASSIEEQKPIHERNSCFRSSA
jgi:OTU domain-containing protein 6